MSSAFGWWRTTLFFFLGKKALFLWKENIALSGVKHCFLLSEALYGRNECLSPFAERGQADSAAWNRFA